MQQITRRQAAQISIAAQMLDLPGRRRASLDDVRRLADQLAVIQIDTICVVARSHYIIPWSRLGHYDPAWFDQLIYPDRQLFEYWGHAASFISRDLLPYFLSRMAERRQKFGPERNAWTAENSDVISAVRQKLSDDGPLTTLHFERPDPETPVEPWEWYGGKPTNQALDYLWHIGEAGINRRINFRREYDLIHRVLPEISTLGHPDIWTERLALADRALVAMGIARPEWLNDYFRTSWGIRTNTPPGPSELLQTLVTKDRAIPVDVDGLGPAFVSADYAGLLDDVLGGYVARRTTLLSPFDNLIWDRQRTVELFDFEYRIECYTPAAKRIYGYFTLPILRRGRLVGRVDPKVDRKAGTFFVRSLHLEPGIQTSKRLIDDIRGTLHAFARWNGASQIVAESVPDSFREPLTGTLD